MKWWIYAPNEFNSYNYYNFWLDYSKIITILKISVL